uniref:Core-binding (CB) domain-containing protein n=1 Tax=viral metagenome TaxID=1070528 RepID=A0A6M3LGU3_9ZZZZ
MKTTDYLVPIEREYEQFRDKQINGMKYRNDEYVISYLAFLRRKGLGQDERNRLTTIRLNRLLEEVQVTPMPPFTWTEENIDKRVR